MKPQIVYDIVDLNQHFDFVEGILRLWIAGVPKQQLYADYGEYQVIRAFDNLDRICGWADSPPTKQIRQQFGRQLLSMFEKYRRAFQVYAAETGAVIENNRAEYRMLVKS